MGLEAQMLADTYSQEELEELRSVVAREATTGKTVTSWTVGDSSAQKMPFLNYPPVRRYRWIYEALSILDPAKYPPEKFIAVEQTRVEFLDVNRCF